ncbi:hypothetical protein BN1708_005240 [Verticillium longisporum]|uniref:Uncharacterized protein n=1 Tax=Verticillium longisporum TaxID=100787 RepID=A0A0G4M948_VERLO|nr:hypothetical protein BN1708_005240 [Verticillium longisporum]
MSRFAKRHQDHMDAFRVAYLSFAKTQLHPPCRMMFTDSCRSVPDGRGRSHTPHVHQNMVKHSRLSVKCAITAAKRVKAKTKSRALRSQYVMVRTWTSIAQGKQSHVGKISQMDLVEGHFWF